MSNFTRLELFRQILDMWQDFKAKNEISEVIMIRMDFKYGDVKKDFWRCFGKLAYPWLPTINS